MKYLEEEKRGEDLAQVAKSEASSGWHLVTSARSYFQNFGSSVCIGI